MLASLHPTSPTSDQAVMDLLDQRARASHTRYTSVAFSQSSDSPSIYSRGDISPNPLYAPLGELPVRSGQPIVPRAGQSAFYDAEGSPQRPPSAIASSPSDSGRYIPAYEDELDNDSTSYISSPTPRPVSRREPDSPHFAGAELESPSLEKIEEDHLRMSLLGPKMRFVSRAPWETGGDDLLEDDEEDASGTMDNLPIFGSKVGGWRGKDPERSPVKGPGFPTFRSRSPGPPSAPLKKGTSMSFGLHRRKTPEPPSDSPYGPYLSNASQSHSALNSLTSSHSVTDSQSSHNLNYKAPIPRVAPGSVSPMSKSNAPPSPPHTNTYNSRTLRPSLSSHDDTSISSFRSESPPHTARIVHPYANPDLLPAIGLPPSTPLPRTPRISRDRSCEEHDRSSPLRRLSESPQSSPRFNLRKACPGGAGFPEPHSWNVRGESCEQEDNRACADDQIHMSMDPTSYLPSHVEQKDGPMRNLISLEQARARVQHTPHLPMVNAPVPRSIPTSTLVAGLGLPPGVMENGVVRGQGQRSATIPFPLSDPVAAQQNQDPPRRRPRTMSSGKHMGGSGGTPRPDGETVPPKALKHKKSAFMKLFQGGKDKEREKEQSKESSFMARPPAFRAVSTPPQTNSNGQSVPPFPGTLNVKRVPPPPLSVVVTSPSIGGSGFGDTAQAAVPDSPPRPRHDSSTLPPSGDEGPSNPPPSRTIHLSPTSSSAPPSQTEFKALSLRPISTMFSAFPDLLSPASPSSNSQTAQKNSNYPSPTTPGLESSRSNSVSTASDFPNTPTSVVPFPNAPKAALSLTEDHSTVVAALQEQIVNSRKAWQRQIWELEGQVKDLKAEVEELRNTGECETCGKARRDGRIRTPGPQSYGIVDRPRPRIGGNTRSVFGGGNDL